MKHSRRPGDVAPNSGTPATFNLDQGTRDKLTWQRHLVKRLLRADAGNSVLMRRAIELYTNHLERLAKKAEGADAEQKLSWEVYALKRAASGERDPLPEAELIAVPVKLFGAIKEEQRKRDAEKAKARTLEPFDPEGFDRD